jgi:5-methyltetrahydrofolate--homocysteine methyltransferase
MKLLSSIEKGVVLLDGAMGTELVRRGLADGTPSELWNLDHPSEVQSVHQAYAEAGSDAILTNSFGANRTKLAASGNDNRIVQINKTAVKLAREAAGGRCLVFGDIGPTGQLPPSLSGVDRSDFADVFMEQAELLAEEEVDALIIETMISAEECALAVEACAELGGLPVIACMSFDVSRQGDFRTVMGDGPGCFARIRDLGASAAGANCGTLDALEMAALIGEIKRIAGLPVAAEPNAGKPVLSGGRTTFPHSPKDMKAGVKALLDSGVRILGGCCGTTPDHIHMMRETLEEVR